MDLEFLNGRFTLIADIYNKEKHGIFYSFMLPKTSGYEKYYTNAVAVRNAGVELALVARVLPATSNGSGILMQIFHITRTRSCSFLMEIRL